MLQVTEEWVNAFPGAHVGILLMTNVLNPTGHTRLEERKRQVEQEIRSRFAGANRATIRDLPTMKAYRDYYQRFGDTYHVQLQLESVALHGKEIPRSSSLVEAMFLSELENHLLTAGHDNQAIEPPIILDVSKGNERYVRINGQEQTPKAGDMMISDALGVMSCIIHGPDSRTRIKAETTEVLYTAYAPNGVGADAVREHLLDIQANVLLVSLEARVELLTVFGS